jgi:gliding motility-associated-like protein
MNSPDNFKEILKRKFNNLEELPPENDWEAFKGKFDLKKGKIQLFRRISFFSSIAVVVIIASVLILSRKNHQKTIPAYSVSTISQDLNARVAKPLNNKPEVQNNPNPIKTTKQLSDLKLKVIKSNGNRINNTQPSQLHDSTIHKSDSSVKKTVIIVSEEKSEKDSKPASTGKQNLNDNIKVIPPVNTKSVDNQIDKISENNVPADNNMNKTDSLSDNNNLNQTDKSFQISPPPNNENVEPEAMNVITPNGDGINDKFVIKNIVKFGPCKLNIYNSWGEKIYSAINYQNTWDGTYKGQLLPEGTYYYVLESGNGKLYKGAVNIIK